MVAQTTIPQTSLDLQILLQDKLEMQPKDFEKTFDIEETDDKLILKVHRDSKGKFVWLETHVWSVTNDYIREVGGSYFKPERKWEIPLKDGNSTPTDTPSSTPIDTPKDAPVPNEIIKDYDKMRNRINKKIEGPISLKHAQSNIGKVSRFGSCVATPIKDIVASPYQVRVDYGDIDGLACDIKQKGLLQPILVRPVDGGKFEVVHGHRRHRAVEGLGWSYIDSFVKDLTDSEAITIQGSENIWRKDYSPIEEARLYCNYRIFLEKESGKRVQISQIAEAFQVPKASVDKKIALLDLPKEIQDKLHNGEIPYSKVRCLTILTKDEAPIGVSGGGHEPAPRTARFYQEINKLANEIEEGNLRTEKGVSTACHAIKEGTPYEKALNQSKVNEAIQIAQKQLRNGKSPEEVLKEIVDHQANPSELLEATIEANVGLLKKMLLEKLILCPHCGKPDLVWGCNGEPLVRKQNEEGN